MALGPVAQAAGYALRRAQLAVFADFIRALASYDLRPGQVSVLLVVQGTPGLRQHQVADALGIKRANFVTLLGRLERRGLIRRQKVEKDHRALALFLTEAGEALVETLGPIWSAHEARVVARLGAAGHAALLRLLESLGEM